MEQEKFKQIYEGYSPLVWSMIGKLGVRDSDRDDIFMESWKAIFNSIDSFGGRARLSTWIARVVRNKAVDHIRRRYPVPLEEIELFQRIEKLDLSGGSYLAMSRSEHHPRAHLIRREGAELIKKALEKLPPKRRFVAEKWMLGFRYREIAELMNAGGDDPVDENFVGKQLYFAKMAVGNFLAEAGIKKLEDLVE